jgi:D-xylose transport system ATP-binding protein
VGVSYLELRGIVKDFPGVRALDGVTLAVDKGRILALCGENGAGKSTLMKILSGIYPYGEYEGEIVIEGEIRRFTGTRDAEEHGVAIIHQELNLFHELTVAENLYVGHEAVGRFGGLGAGAARGAGAACGVVDWGRTYAAASAIIRQYDLDLDPAAPVHDLKLGQMQLVEIIKALERRARILVLDEPTSALSDTEVEKLFRIMRRLQADGVTMVYISHKIDELKRICDEVAVLRDGKSVMAPAPASGMTKDDIVRAMVGRDLTDLYPRVETTPGRPLLEVEDWQVRHPLLPGEFLVVDVSFTVRAGEVFGIYGIMGSGRTEVITSIFAGFPTNCWDGTLKIAGREVSFRGPRDAIDAGVALVTEDRKLFGLVLGLSVGANISLPSLDRVARAGVVDDAAERNTQDRLIRELRIKTPSAEQLVGNLSGGNQQKVVLAKWLATGPKVLLLDEPTRGVDIGAKQEIYHLINELKKQGVAVVMVTSEMPELLGMSDRLMVMHEGWQVGTFERGEIDAERLGALATGNV